jgi:arylsulfatase A-like enzyme
VDRLARGRSTALAHVVMLVLLQVESFALYAARPGDAGRFALALPFLQLENLAVAAALGALAAGLPARAWSRASIVALVGAANVYAIVDQVAYKLYLDHFRPSWNDGPAASARFFLDSFRAEAGWPVALNLLVALVLAVALARALSREVGPARPRLAGWILLAMLLGASVPLRRTLHFSNLEHHPLVTLARDLLAPSREVPEPTGTAPLRTFDRPTLDARPTPAREALSIAKARRALEEGRARRPNVVLVVLESVGARQLLPDAPALALPREDTTPYLRELASHGLLFDSIYTSFPGTMRSHVALHMGGRTLTYGSVWQELAARSRAPKLATELRARGYATGCFYPAFESYENLDRFYGSMSLDRHVSADVLDPAFVEAHRISSWGMEERPFAEMAADWAASVKQPFFLTFLTLSTHHPYATPPGWNGPFPGNDGPERYGNALHYTDAMIHELLARLDAHGLLEDTIVAVTGDHGEAFAERHVGNLAHNNRIYEENVRSFLLLAAPRRPIAPLRTDRVGSMGDVMPTLLDLVGGSAPSLDVPGQDLLSEDYAPRTVYFHKNIYPAQWGLRDGRWKFIEKEQGEHEPELYDLDSDPFEQKNLAGERPAMVAVCHKKCAGWFVSAHADFVDHLEGFTMGRPLLRAEDVTTTGAKLLLFGRMLPDGRFEALEKVDPYEEVVAFTEWINGAADRSVTFEWRAPGGGLVSNVLEVKAQSCRTWSRLPVPLPLEQGTWTLTLREGPRALLSGELAVVASTGIAVPLAERMPRLVALEPVACVPGVPGLLPLSTPEPNAQPAVLARWAPRRDPVPVRVRVAWRGPAARRLETTADVEAGDCVFVMPRALQAPGKWSFEVSSVEHAVLGQLDLVVDRAKESR